MVKLSCKTCGVGYEVADYRKLLSKYCSRSCHGKVAGKVGGKAERVSLEIKALKDPTWGRETRLLKYREKGIFCGKEMRLVMLPYIPGFLELLEKQQNVSSVFL